MCVFQLILISLHPLCMLVYQLSTQQPDCTCMCVWGVPFLFHSVSLSLCRRRDKVIIFSDMVFALRSYAQKLQRWDSNFSLNCPESIFPSFLPPSSTSSLLLPSPFSLSSSQPFHWRSDSSKWADANSTKLCPQSQHQHHFHLQGNVISLMHTLTQMAKAREKLRWRPEYCDQYWIAAARMACIYLSRLFSQMIAMTTRQPMWQPELDHPQCLSSSHRRLAITLLTCQMLMCSSKSQHMVAQEDRWGDTVLVPPPSEW